MDGSTPIKDSFFKLEKKSSNTINLISIKRGYYSTVAVDGVSGTYNVQ